LLVGNLSVGNRECRQNIVGKRSCWQSGL